VDIFDKARKALGDLAQSASDQARSLHVQGDMSQVEQEMDRQYIEAGKRARTLWGQRLILDTDFGILMKRIDELDQELERLRTEMFSNKPAPAACAGCGEKLTPEDKFCRKCGKPVG
jgi:hypothetical protein